MPQVKASPWLLLEDVENWGKYFQKFLLVTFGSVFFVSFRSDTLPLLLASCVLHLLSAGFLLVWPLPGLLVSAPPGLASTSPALLEILSLMELGLPVVLMAASWSAIELILRLEWWTCRSLGSLVGLERWEVRGGGQAEREKSVMEAPGGRVGSGHQAVGTVQGATEPGALHPLG